VAEAAVVEVVEAVVADANVAWYRTLLADAWCHRAVQREERE
jgi:hypothetical protein